MTASKTEAGERIVPISGQLGRRCLSRRLVRASSDRRDLVFPTVVGTGDSVEAWVMREFYPAMRRAGLEGAFRFHDLRHYAVSCLIEQGANILLVSRVAGHARPSITLDVYSHLFKDGLAEAALRFDPLRRNTPLSRVSESTGSELVDRR